MNIDIHELERRLAGDQAPHGQPDLGTIRRQGVRRRRVRSALAGGAAALAVVGVVGVGLAVTDGGPERARDTQVATQQSETPRTLSPLARRALEEVPGAQQVSPWQVTVPAPGVDRPFTPAGEVVGRPVELPGHYYTGVTMYRASDFPDWLYRGTEEVEQEAGDENGYPVGSTDLTGVLVDVGPTYLGCSPAHPDEPMPGAECSPGVFTQRVGGGWTLEYGLGSETFLVPGEPMQVFTDETFPDGAVGTLAIAGVDGTEVAEAEFVTTDGTVVEGAVEAGTIAPGDSLFFAAVPGELARVVAYDADGDVIEDHELTPCDTPVECEVR